MALSENYIVKIGPSIDRDDCEDFLRVAVDADSELPSVVLHYKRMTVNASEIAASLQRTHLIACVRETVLQHVIAQNSVSSYQRLQTPCGLKVDVGVSFAREASKVEGEISRRTEENPHGHARGFGY
jgi:hypothetical protein